MLARRSCVFEVVAITLRVQAIILSLFEDRPALRLSFVALLGMIVGFAGRSFNTSAVRVIFSRITKVNHLAQGRRRFLATGFSFFAAAFSLGSIVGCSDDKSGGGPIENAPDPAEKAKDSMNAYKDSHLKGGAKKK